MNNKFDKLVKNTTKEEIIDLFINQDLTAQDCADHYNVGIYVFNQLLDYYNIPRKPCYRRAGSSKLDKVLARINKEEFINDYLINNLRREDMQKKYDIPEIFVFEQLVKYYDCKKDKSAVMKLTNETGLKNAGSKEAYDEYRLNRRKETYKEKYGSVEGFYNLLSEKGKETYKDGSKLEHMYATRRTNNTFNTSEPEDELYEQLVAQYGEDNVIRQYKEARYPFMCDFYIKSEDLFIELNAHWSHGPHPFDANSEEDQKLLAEWQEKAKTSRFYSNAIRCWTRTDLHKINTAKANNLNYKLIY